MKRLVWRSDHSWLLPLAWALLYLCGCAPPAERVLQPARVASLDYSALFPTDIKLAPDGTVWVAYIDAATRQLRIKQNDRPSELLPTQHHAQQTEFSFSLALTAGGAPAIAYVAEPSGDLVYAERRSARWTTETIDADGQVSYFVSLAFDRQGRPHLSYFDQTNNDVKYAARTESGWRIETIDASGLPGFHIPAGFTRLALVCVPSPQQCTVEQPRVAYLAYRYKPYDGELRYAAYDGQSWQIEVVDSARGAGGFPSLALDQTGQPWISYYRLSTWDFTLGELRLAHRGAHGWQIEVIDQGDYVGRYNALALTPEGRPVIAYNVATPGVLRLAWRDQRWQRARVAAADASGAWVALALDPDSAAHLTYADANAHITRSITVDIPD
jgi:hypothetical protein